MSPPDPLSYKWRLSSFNLMSDYSVNWTASRVTTWEPFLAPLRDRPVKAIEIGTYEARTAVWFLEHVLTDAGSHLHCIDPYGYIERKEIPTDQHTTAKRRAEVNLKPFGKKVTLTCKPSLDVLPTLPVNSYDLIYVDGQHTAGAALYDLVRSFALLKPGGIVMVDDMEIAGTRRAKWGNDNPRTAVEAFLALNVPGASKLWLDVTAGIRKGEPCG